MNLQDEISVLKNNITIIEKEWESLQSGRKSAAPKLRANLMSIKKQCHNLRSKTTEFTKNLPTKTRVKKEPVEVVVAEHVATPVVEVKVRKPRSKKPVQVE